MLMSTDYPDKTVLSSRWFLSDPICTTWEVTRVTQRNNECIENMVEEECLPGGWRGDLRFRLPEVSSVGDKAG